MNEVRQALPVFGRMLRPALQSALALLRKHLSYNMVGALAVLFSSVAALIFWFPGTLSYVGFTPAGVVWPAVMLSSSFRPLPYVRLAVNVSLLTSPPAVAAMETPAETALLDPPAATRRHGWAGNRSEDSVATRFESVLRRYNIDPDACLKVAMCSVGRLGASADADAGPQGKQRRQAGPVEVLDSMLSLTLMDEVLLSRGLRSARQVGEAGGDCDAFNRGGKCPFNAAAWKVLLSTINRSLA
ncbi:hypothetical protein V5799_001064 [Amblyomma americanum]|uniref:Uncharacterized protein n=2 Tax=Amblyomma americanum TaxID=6943 RepID=A0AAQ4D192_AMBAM